ncbi:hypothetical protein [Crossiella sp. NPDC003009]
MLTGSPMFRWPDGRAIAWALVGLVVLAVSEIVWRGAVLREEVEGTV